MKAACWFLATADRAVSRRSVQAFLRLALGEGYSTDEIAPVIAAFKTTRPSGPIQVQNGSTSGPSSNGKTAMQQGLFESSGPTKVRSRSSRARVVKELGIEPLSPNGDSAEPEWATTLRVEFEKLHPLAIQKLDGMQLIIVARYWALVFGYCRAKEQTNRTKAMENVLPSLVNYRDILSRERRPMITVARFEAAAKAMHAERGERPWFTPAALKAFLVAR